MQILLLLRSDWIMINGAYETNCDWWFCYFTPVMQYEHWANLISSDCLGKYFQGDIWFRLHLLFTGNNTPASIHHIRSIGHLLIDRLGSHLTPLAWIPKSIKPSSSITFKKYFRKVYIFVLDKIEFSPKKQSNNDNGRRRRKKLQNWLQLKANLSKEFWCWNLRYLKVFWVPPLLGFLEVTPRRLGRRYFARVLGITMVLPTGEFEPNTWHYSFVPPDRIFSTGFCEG